MRLVPLILDSRAGFARGPSGPLSVLSLPLGAGTLLGHLLRQIAGSTASDAVVAAAPGAGPVRLAESEQGLRTRSVDPGGLRTLIDEADRSDVFLVLDTRSWPTVWPSAGDLLASAREYRGVTHVIAVGTRLDRANERIECGADGQVRRIHRLYATADWPEVAGESIAYSLVPARALKGVRFDSTRDLRRGLAARGMLSRDKPLATDVMDLTEVAAYLALSERVVGGGGGGGRSHSAGCGVVISESAHVAATARLVPPVIVREGAVIEEGALVVGPALIGPGVQVRREAVVAQAVVLPQTQVPARAVLRQEVYRSAEVRPAAGIANGHRSRSRTPVHGPVSIGPRIASRRRNGRSLTLAVKRGIDFTAAACALIALAPLLIAISILIKLDSRGPVLFGHARERQGGKEFRCLKFRTMVPDADERQRELAQKNQVDGPQFKLANDPRVTRIGHWLRATNLDELPQFINVLRGDMSLVGPRPSPFRENQICVAWRQARLSVRPGITGLWQICRAADRSQGDFHEWIYYDLAYVRRLSIWLDLKILAATVLTLGGHRHIPPSWLLCDLRDDPHGQRAGRV